MFEIRATLYLMRPLPALIRVLVDKRLSNDHDAADKGLCRQGDRLITRLSNSHILFRVQTQAFRRLGDGNKR